jgi:hypothetical protein
MKIFTTTLRFGVRRLLAFSLTLVILNLPAAFASTGPAEAFGTLKVRGDVTVNDVPALSGQTILSSSRIVTASSSDSVLELGNFTRLTLAEETELALDFCAASISGTLGQGELRAFIPAARTMSITTADGVVATDSTQAAVFSVRAEPNGTRISVETGRVELRSGNNRRVLAAGETFSTTRDSFAGLTPQQNLSHNQRLGIIAGIGTGIAILLTAITLGRSDETENFGGCAIVLSSIDGNPSGCN